MSKCRNPKVSVRSAKLRNAIDDAGLSQTEVAKRSRAIPNVAAISDKTVWRAVNEGVVQLKSIESICAVLGVNTAEYYESHGIKGQDFEHLLGIWSGNFLEILRDGSIENVKQQIEVKNIDDEIFIIGGYESDGEFLDEIYEIDYCHGEMLSGKISFKDWRYPDGISYFQLKLFDGGQILDGYIIWADATTKRVECSEYIWIRHDRNDPVIDEFVENRLDSARKRLFK